MVSHLVIMVFQKRYFYKSTPANNLKKNTFFPFEISESTFRTFFQIFSANSVLCTNVICNKIHFCLQRWQNFSCNNHIRHRIRNTVHQFISCLYCFRYYNKITVFVQWNSRFLGKNELGARTTKFHHYQRQTPKAVANDNVQYFVPFDISKMLE